MSACASKFFKCVTVGDGAVGKTCMLMCYTGNKFPTNLRMIQLMVLLAMLVILLVQATEGTSWCVARNNLSESLVQSGLDYACRSGAYCGPINPGGRCYLPNTLQSHASYAFNSYYQSKSRGPGSCGFSPAAAVVSTDPSM